MYTHEYSDKHFDSYDACRDDFLENIDEDDIAQYLDLTVPDIISAFLRNKNNVDFSVWFQEKIDEAITYAENDLILNMMKRTTNKSSFYLFRRVPSKFNFFQIFFVHFAQPLG